MKAILLIDHGSKRAEANEMLACMANLVQAMTGPGVIVEHAHMELAEPDIPAGFAACVARGATEVIPSANSSRKVAVACANNCDHRVTSQPRGEGSDTSSEYARNVLLS